MTKLSLWLRWSWRDLRAQRLHVIAIALIIALGTAVYVGLGSTTPWRMTTTDNSYDLLNMYDLRVILNRGSYTPRDELIQIIQSIEHNDQIAAIESRLITPTLVSTTNGVQDILVRGQLVGVEVMDGGPHVNGLHIAAGRQLTTADAGQNTAIVEYHFADHYELPPQGQIDVSGNTTVEYVGWGMSPEFFMVATEEGGLWAQASFAVIFVSLETAQTLTDHPDMINDLVLTLKEGADREVVRAEIKTAVDQALPNKGVSFKYQEDDAIYRLMYQSIAMNQKIYDIMITLFLAGAMFGAFNLSSRIVEAQRRQIGIGMALGMPPRLLVIRPLLVGAQIAILGALLGLVLGIFVGRLTGIWLEGLIPLPVSSNLFQLNSFLEAAALGIILPFVATIFPVWHAMRIQPVDAINTGYLASKGSGLAAWITTLSLPGRSFTQIPVRNLLRSPRRTGLMILGIASAITTLISLVGILDGAVLVLDQTAQEAFQDHPERLTVFLNNNYPLSSTLVNDIQASPLLSMTEPAIRAPGNATHGATTFKVLIEVLDLNNELWTPTLAPGSYVTSSDQPGVLISEKAAADLRITVGDTFMLEHPRREGLFTYPMITTEVQVIGLHVDPWRTFVYMDREQAGLMGLQGMINMLHVDPGAEIDSATIKHRLFQSPGVASIISVRDLVQANEGVLEEVIRFLSGVKLAVLVMAFLIAFNSTSINMNERAREIATMFAFGLPIRTTTRMLMIENLMTGVLGTLLGIGLGFPVLIWFSENQMPKVLPEMLFPVTLSSSTIMLALLMGVGVVALTPVLTIRKLMNMDIPSTLRVME